MARIEIALPARFPFPTAIPIRIGALNYGGHRGTDAVLAIAHEARVRFLAAHGWTELALAGVGILMIDAAIQYRAEGFHGMTLRVDVAPADVRTRDCDLLYRLADAATGREIARVKTGIVFTDRKTGRLVRMPDPVRAVLAPAEPPQIA